MSKFVIEGKRGDRLAQGVPLELPEPERVGKESEEERRGDWSSTV